MKFNITTPWKNGDRRIKTRFLWFPKTLRIKKHPVRQEQTRWLEKASWEEEYYGGYWLGNYWNES